MIDPITAIGGGAALGTLGGGLFRLINLWADHKRDASKAQTEKEIALANKSKEHFEAMYSQPIHEEDLESSSCVKLVIWGKEFSYEKKKRKENTYTPFMVKCIGYSLLMLVTALTLSVIIWADNPSQVIYTFDPSGKPASISIWFFNWVYGATEVQAVTAGGLACLLLGGMMSIIHFVMIGVPFNKKN